MQEIIKISEELIGAEKVNSVNARDLHKTLEIKKDFSNWIKRQITSLGLDENMDYIRFAQKGEANNATLIEYILTIDTAKHISMASRTAKGKEVRAYFIEVEKQAKLAQPQNDMLDVVLKLVENQQRQTDAILDLVSDMKDHISKPQIQQSQYIDSRSRKKIRDAINAKAKEEAEEIGVAKDTIAPSLWIELKRFFDVDDYQDILQSQVGAVMHFIMFWEAKKRPSAKYTFSNQNINEIIG